MIALHVWELGQRMDWIADEVMPRRFLVALAQ